MNTTVCVIEGTTEYEHDGYHHRLDELLDARASAVEFLLRHGCTAANAAASPSTPSSPASIIHPGGYDLLRGLDALAEAGVPYDARMDDALEVLTVRRRPDGRWAANKAYPGSTYLPQVHAGEPSAWITLIALRVLKTYAPARSSPIKSKRKQQTEDRRSCITSLRERPYSAAGRPFRLGRARDYCPERVPDSRLIAG